MCDYNQYNDKIIEDELLGKIWKDADFKSQNLVKKSATEIKKASIRKLNDNNMIVTNCKICNCEMKISNNYTGDYPLCYAHRNPNDRELKPFIPKQFKNKKK